MRADACAWPAAEREVGVRVPRPLALGAEPGWVERLRVLPELWVAVGDVLADRDERAGRDEVAADLVIGLGHAAERVGGGIQAHRFLERHRGPPEGGRVLDRRRPAMEDRVELVVD